MDRRRQPREVDVVEQAASGSFALDDLVHVMGGSRSRSPRTRASAAACLL